MLCAIYVKIFHFGLKHSPAIHRPDSDLVPKTDGGVIIYVAGMCCWTGLTTCGWSNYANSLPCVSTAEAAEAKFC